MGPIGLRDGFQKLRKNWKMTIDEFCDSSKLEDHVEACKRNIVRTSNSEETIMKERDVFQRITALVLQLFNKEASQKTTSRKDSGKWWIMNTFHSLFGHLLATAKKPNFPDPMMNVNTRACDQYCERIVRDTHKQHCKQNEDKMAFLSPAECCEKIVQQWGGPRSTLARLFLPDAVTDFARFMTTCCPVFRIDQSGEHKTRRDLCKSVLLGNEASPNTSLLEMSRFCDLDGYRKCGKLSPKDECKGHGCVVTKERSYNAMCCEYEDDADHDCVSIWG